MRYLWLDGRCNDNISYLEVDKSPYINQLDQGSINRYLYYVRLPEPSATVLLFDIICRWVGGETDRYTSFNH